jgi:hypothetical protein
VLDLEGRRVQVVGSTPNPDAAFMVQALRRLTDAVSPSEDGYERKIVLFIGPAPGDLMRRPTA